METQYHMVAGVRITARKLRIVALLACGRSQKEVAVLLKLSPGTVKNYLGRLRDRFGGMSLAQLMMLLAKEGLDTRGYLNGVDLLAGTPEVALLVRQDA